MYIPCPHCQTRIEIVEDKGFKEVVCPSCGSSFRFESRTTTAWSPDQGDRKLERFELIDTVGVGAFGTVYMARDPELDRVVAIKIPRSGNLATGDDLNRFVRESRSVAQLRHPGIVPIYEVGQADGLPFLVSEYVRGTTLADRITAQRFTPREAVELVTAIADTLHYAHNEGVVHRDVKPANIMLDSDAGHPSESRHSASVGSGRGSSRGVVVASLGMPRLMDFGLAKRDAGEVTMTIEGQVLGTPAYMSPEQAAGAAHQVDGRSDVYSLGVIFYELLTGELPFRGNQRMLIHQVLHNEPRKPRSLNDRIPRDLETICLKAMAKDPSKRYSTAGEVGDELRRWLAGKPIAARPVGATARIWRWSKRNPVVASLGVMVASLLLFLAIAGPWVALRERRRREELEWDLYVDRVNLAQREWLGNNARTAEQLLDSCPQRYRGWEWEYCKRLCHLDICTIDAGLGELTGIAFDPKSRGRHVAFINRAGIVEVWDIETATRVCRAVSPGSKVRPSDINEGADRTLTFSADGEWLVFAGQGNMVGVWNGRSIDELKVDLAPETGVTSVACSSDKKWIAAGASDGSVTVWDAEAHRVKFTQRGHSDAVSCVAFSPNGNLLASAGWDGQILVFDTSGSEVWSARGDPRIVYSVEFSPDGLHIASGGWDNTVKIWQLSSDRLISVLRGHTSFVRSVRFGPGGKLLASASEDYSIKLWDVQSWTEFTSLRGHNHFVEGVAFSSDGHRLASASLDGRIKVWDTRWSRPQLTLVGHSGWVHTAAFTSHGKQIVSGSTRFGTPGEIKIWNVSTGMPGMELEHSNAPVKSVVSLPNARFIAGCRGRRILVWSAETGRIVRRLEAHVERVSSLSVSTDGNFLLSGSYDRTVKLWDTDGWRVQETYTGHKAGVVAVQFGPIKGQVASLDSEGSVRIWDRRIPENSVRATVDLHSWVTRSNLLAFSPDGHLMAVAGGKRSGPSVWVFNTKTGQLAFELRGHVGRVNGVAFSPDGMRIATSSNDQTIKLWDTRTRREVLTLRGHKSGVLSVLFSPDGHTLASTSIDNSIRLWCARDPR